MGRVDGQPVKTQGRRDEEGEVGTEKSVIAQWRMGKYTEAIDKGHFSRKIISVASIAVRKMTDEGCIELSRVHTCIFAHSP